MDSFIPEPLEGRSVVVPATFQGFPLLKSHVQSWSPEDRQRFADKPPTKSQLKELIPAILDTELHGIQATALQRLIAEFCHICESRNAAWHLLIDVATGKPKRQASQGQHSDTELILHEIKHSSKPLNHRGFASIIRKAAQEDDQDFFIQLGRRLYDRQRHGPHLDMDWTRAERIQVFLVLNWLGAESPFPDLCHMTLSAITDLCQLAFEDITKNLSEDTLGKTIRRLGLVRFKTSSVKRCSIKGAALIFE